MKKILIASEFQEYFSADELPAQENELLTKAEEATQSAYAPYSELKVGAAILLEDGRIICGSNQENAAYPAGLCAERVALFAASSQHPGKKIMAVAVAAFTGKRISQCTAAPCGSCRQVMAEYEMLYAQPIKIIFRGEGGKVLVAEGIKNFLPFAFSKKDLGK